MMKIAILLLCHKNSKQINLLLQALNHPKIDIFVHVDAKSENLREKIDKREGVYLLPEKECINVKWAQFSQVIATLSLLNYAISVCGGEYSHYLLISGQDFPIKSANEIVEFLAERKNDNFIDCSEVKKFEKRNDIAFPAMIIGKKLWQKILKNVLVYSTGGWNDTITFFKRKAPNNVKYYFGSQWWCLNGQTVLWIKDYLQKHKEYQEFFNKSLCADECFFQTLVMNSPYADRIKPYLHYIKWEAESSSPQILTTLDYDDLLNTTKLIARKFDTNIDGEIINILLDSSER